MTAREPTEAMRLLGQALWDAIVAAEAHGQDSNAPAKIARALLEQDTAARRALVEEIAVALLRRFPNQIGEDAVRVVRALTPEPPSEKENEGG